jgi:minor histocompatibility antigen H13
MLRFDRSRSEKLAGEVTGDQIQTADKTYFVTCIASYVFGLTLTIVANTVSGAAQPALLYLVPSLLFGVFVVAASRSEATLLFAYKEEQLSPVPVKSEDQSLD